MCSDYTEENVYDRTERTADSYRIQAEYNSRDRIRNYRDAKNEANLNEIEKITGRHKKDVDAILKKMQQVIEDIQKSKANDEDQTNKEIERIRKKQEEELEKSGGEYNKEIGKKLSELKIQELEVELKAQTVNTDFLNTMEKIQDHEIEGKKAMLVKKQEMFEEQIEEKKQSFENHLKFVKEQGKEVVEAMKKSVEHSNEIQKKELTVHQAMLNDEINQLKETIKVQLGYGSREETRQINSQIQKIRENHEEVTTNLFSSQTADDRAKKNVASLKESLRKQKSHLSSVQNCIAEMHTTPETQKASETILKIKGHISSMQMWMGKEGGDEKSNKLTEAFEKMDGLIDELGLFQCPSGGSIESIITSPLSSSSCGALKNE